MDRPLQVILEDRDYRELSAWAKQRGWTKSQAVRVAIRALTQPRESRGLLAASGFIDGLPGDLSAHFDRYLEETFVVPKKHSRARAVRR